MFNSILKAMAPAAIDLMFKSMKPVILAEESWVFDPARDQAGVTEPDAQSAGKKGLIRLYKISERRGEFLGMCPYLIFFMLDKQRLNIRISDVHWQIPTFQPYQAEYEAWHASVREKANAEKSEQQEKQQQIEIQQAAAAARAEQERIDNGPDDYYGFDGEKLIHFGWHASLGDAEQVWHKHMDENQSWDVLLFCQSRTKWLRVLEQFQTTLNHSSDTDFDLLTTSDSSPPIQH